MSDKQNNKQFYLYLNLFYFFFKFTYIQVFFWVKFLKEVGVRVCHFQQYFSYIVVISIIDGGNLSTWGETTNLPQVTDKLLSPRVMHLVISSIQTHKLCGDRH